MSAIVDELRMHVLKSYGTYERAKQRFAEVTAAYTEIPGIDPVNAEFRASSDPRRRKAVDDCTFARAEMQAYASALTALLLAEQRTSWDQHCADATRLTIRTAERSTT